MRVPVWNSELLSETARIGVGGYESPCSRKPFPQYNNLVFLLEIV